jgi:outer membrane protein TolC
MTRKNPKMRKSFMRSTVPLALAALLAPSAAHADRPVSRERVGFVAAVNRALERNTSVEIARQEIARAEALVREVRAASFPTLIGNGTYTRLDAERKIGANTFAGQDQLAANVTLTVPLVAPQRWLQWAHAKDSVDVARANSAEARRDIAIAVAKAYIAVVSQNRTVDVSERALQTAKAHYDFAHTRLTGGVGNRIDDVRAEQEVATDEAQLQLAYSGLSRTREALGVLIGTDGPVDVEDEVPFGAEAPNLATALDEAQTRRQDIQSLTTRVQATDRVVRDDWADYMPMLSGVFQPFYQKGQLTQPASGWQAQLILTVPFYEGGLRYGQAAERHAVAAEARTQLEGALREARADVRGAFAAVRRADLGLVAAQRAATLARSALELSTLAYRAGATTNLEVIDAERRARDAETAAVVAEDTARRARVDLLAASGRFP